MGTTTAGTASDHIDVAPVEKTGGRFGSYLSLLRDAFLEALDRTYDARRKYPFADV